MKRYLSHEKSFLLLRVALGYVFLWFAFSQITDPSRWIYFLPEFTANIGIDQTAFVLLNGWFELVLGTMLLVGFRVRIVSFFLGAHLLAIAVEAGGAIGVRDLGLGMATLAVLFHDTSYWSVDGWLAENDR